MLVETSRAETETPTTIAPVLSVTVPRSVDKPCCPHTGEHKSNENKSKKHPNLITRGAGVTSTDIPSMGAPLFGISSDFELAIYPTVSLDVKEFFESGSPDVAPLLREVHCLS